MKIAIDTQTTVGQKTGFGFYVENLVSNLKVIAPQNRYLLIKPRHEQDLKTPFRWWWDQIIIPARAYRARVDLLHQPAFSAPILYPGKVVVTVHDLIAIFFGKDIPFVSRQYFGRWMPFSYQHADHIIAVSEHTKKDVVSLLKIPETKISVIASAADDIYFQTVSLSKIRQVKKKYKIKGKYLLHVGTLNPRKNLQFLVKAFSVIKRRYPEYKLVLTGKKGWYYQGLFNQIRNKSLTNEVVFTDYIAESDKPALYQGAFAFVFPSLYEGFGLPPLEAQASGLPVVASNMASVPEVVGDGGILLPPSDAKAWVRAIDRLHTDNNLRERLIRLGRENAKKFSWRKTARLTNKVYERVLSTKRD